MQPPLPATVSSAATKTLPVQASRSLQILTQPSPATTVDPRGILKYVSPGPVSDEIESLVLFGAHDRRTRNSVWISEHITAESVAQSVAKRNNGAFAEDRNIPLPFRARMKDYHRSGYDRSHQAPAGNASWSQKAMDDTFKLSNMCPQVGEGFNRHYWARFEDFCRNLTQRYPSVRVITGPLYLPKQDEDGKWRVHYEVIGNPPNVAVHTHFYKIIYAENSTGEGSDEISIGAFVLPNARIDKETPLADFEVEVGIIERASGLELMSNLNDVYKRLCEEVSCDVNVRNFRKELVKSTL
ncbi:hypothetical protein N7451_003514 [Penicillium sp. IBT 35674x]|nr:hypothetical protein N7451_003514 [Penicillium sp. IBT 35674x]